MDHCANHSLFLPIIPFEYTWNVYIRGSLYFFCLVYFFLGVAIVSDIFMAAIETIVSLKKEVPCTLGDGENKVTIMVEVTTWNSTVANLTLMALGSSAPEILLSVIEICGNNFESGDLGPGTIVGSAAFNLLFITAVCVLCVPDGETRRIDVYTVFIITSLFSLFAYIWMLIVLDFISPGIIEVWEAVFTLLCFPLLVITAWWADNGFCLKGKKPRKSFLEQAEEIKRMQTSPGITVDGGPEIGLLGANEHPLYINGQINPVALLEFYKTIRQVADITDEEAASLIAAKLIEAKEHSRLWYRIGACRGLMGGTKLQPVLNEKLQQVYDVINEHHMESTGRKGNLRVVETNPEIFLQKAIFEFQAASFAVPESIGILTVVILRTGRADTEVAIRVMSIDGTAKEGSDYEKIDQEIIFEPFVYERTVSCRIIDDNQWEPDESFFLRLSFVDPNQEDAIFGQTHTMEITIIDDDLPGTFAFVKRGMLVSDTSRDVAIEIERSAGNDGIVTTKWRTFPDTTNQPIKMPRSIEGSVTFLHGEKRKSITIPLLSPPSDTKIRNETFDIELYEPAGGAIIGKISRISVTISNDAHFQLQVSKVVDMAAQNMEGSNSANTTYADQLKSAFSVNGGNIDDAEKLDYVLHFCTFFWKILFSLIPPPNLAGGWLCFGFSLLAIGMLTALIGDLASIFGCIINLKDTITAITLVALGTSLPDTFASKAAAMMDKNADNAVGNVTGSNSVNVFLGLGVPWTIAAIYHHIKKDGGFKVESGSLAFSVFVYSGVAFLALGLLVMRRYTRLWGHAELGGPRPTKIITAVVLIGLWLLYVALSSAQAYGYIPPIY